METEDSLRRWGCQNKTETTTKTGRKDESCAGRGGAADRLGGGTEQPTLTRRLVNPLTIFGDLDLGSFVFPDDAGGRRADHVTDNVGIVALVELLRGRGAVEGNLLCRGQAQCVLRLSG